MADTAAGPHHRLCRWLLASAVAFIGAPTAAADSTAEAAVSPNAEQRQFTFSWMFSDGDAMAPRGGTTEGAPVTLADGPTEAWQALQSPELDKQARDRQAILAMAGPYRASFDFIETVGFSPGYTPARPYRSWGTEYVYVVADEPSFISLQHVLVMDFAATADGDAPQGPVVVKHWRQDWHYEAGDYHEFRGDRRWSRTRVDDDARAGSWVQTVWQVDDSPRYASRGRWRHESTQSIWEGEATLRPLPRREFSVRDDYDALRAVNRHIITPTGWVHEEQNEKLVLGDDPRILAREVGLNRYERIVDHDFSAGDAYWARTAPFWAEVRAAWQRLFAAHDAVRFEARTDDGLLFMKLFEYAQTLEADAPFDADAVRQFVAETLANHVDQPVPSRVGDESPAGDQSPAADRFAAAGR